MVNARDAQVNGLVKQVTDLLDTSPVNPTFEEVLFVFGTLTMGALVNMAYDTPTPKQTMRHNFDEFQRRLLHLIKIGMAEAAKQHSPHPAPKEMM